MKILLIGKNGQIGWELNKSLTHLGQLVTLGRQDADLLHPEYLRNKVQEISPDVIVNAAAYTAVDKAEEEEEQAAIINGIAPGILADEAKKLGALLVHYSTDYVFDGTKEGAYKEEDKPNPVNSYGRSKLAGELAIQSSGCDYLIFRTSWVYASRGNNFLLTILKLASERDTLNIVSDQIGSPTTARLIANTSCSCIKQAMKARINRSFSSGLYHLVTSGHTSWHGFAEEIINNARSQLGLNLKIKELNAIQTKHYPTPAKRPKNSQLNTEKIINDFDIILPSWQSELALCIYELMQ